MSCPKSPTDGTASPIVGETSEYLEIFVDSDWAGCQRTRKSTNGGGIMWNGACLNFWSTTQTVIAMSSGEAEYYAAVKGGAEGLAMQSMAKDLGIDLKIRVHTDSSACRGICGRTDIGKVRRMAVPLLWLQGAVREKKIEMARIAEKDNPADVLTKFVSQEDLDRHCR